MYTPYFDCMLLVELITIFLYAFIPVTLSIVKIFSLELEKIVFKLAENNSNHWKNIDLDSLNQNSTGFTAIPTGCMNEDGSFKETYTSCYWWSNSHYYQNFSCYFNIDLKSKNHNHLNGSQNIGMPVRCVKD